MTTNHPIVGSWRVAVDVPEVNLTGVNLASYGRDGTVTVAFPSPVPAAPGSDHKLEFFTTALGSWADTGNGETTMMFVAIGTDENGRQVVSHTISASVTVAPDGATWSGPFSMEIAATDGTVRAVLTGTVSATRIEPKAPKATTE
jgi:hypothetical protein